MTGTRLSRVLVLACILFFLAGCAHSARTLRTDAPSDAQWQGRLSILVQSTPVQTFTANFDLQGDADNGSLALSSALGSTLARLQWTHNTATLQARGETLQFDSLDALVRHATGTDLPVASLFAWLGGNASCAPGWSADLSDVANGRLSAQREGPPAPASLKIILDR